MAPGAVVFAVLFLALPLAGLLAVAVAGLGVTVAVASVLLLAIGFTLALGFLDWR